MTFLQTFLTQVSIHGFAKKNCKQIFSQQSGISAISKFCPFRKIRTDHSWGFQFKQIQSTLETRSEWVCNCNTLFLHLSLQFIPRDENHFVEKVNHGQWKTSNVGKTKWVEKSVSAIWHLKRSGCVQGCLGSAPFLDSRSEAEPRKLPAVESHLKPIAISTQEQQLLLKHPSSHLSPNILEGPDHLTSSQPSAEVRSQPAVAAVRPSLLSLWANQAHVTTRGLYISYFLKHHQEFFPTSSQSERDPPSLIAVLFFPAHDITGQSGSIWGFRTTS